MMPFNRDWLEPVDAAKWPTYLDYGSNKCYVLFYCSAFMHSPIDQFLSDCLVFSIIRRDDSSTLQHR